MSEQTLAARLRTIATKLEEVAIEIEWIETMYKVENEHLAKILSQITEIRRECETSK